MDESYGTYVDDEYFDNHDYDDDTDDDTDADTDDDTNDVTDDDTEDGGRGKRRPGGVKREERARNERATIGKLKTRGASEERAGSYFLQTFS